MVILLSKTNVFVRCFHIYYTWINLNTCFFKKDDFDIHPQSTKSSKHNSVRVKLQVLKLYGGAAKISDLITADQIWVSIPI